MNTNRIKWVDCAKGITILLVVFAHTINTGSNLEGIIRGVIFSFHMPLFFILSCVTFKPSQDENDFFIKTERAFKHLVIPVIVLFLLRIIYEIILNKLNNDIANNDIQLYLSGIVNRFVYASGVTVTVANTEIQPLGMLWFLVVLFFSRTFFDYLQLKLGTSKILLFVCIFSSLIGVGISYIQWLPFSLDIVLAIMPFLWYGNYLKNIEFTNKTFLKFGIFSVLFCLFLVVEFILCRNYLELACRRYALYPISFVIAILGTMAVAYFSQLLQKIKIFCWLNFIGEKSFLIFSIHYLDFLWKPLCHLTGNNIVDGFIRCVIDVAIMSFCYLVLLKLEQRKNKRLG